MGPSLYEPLILGS